MEKILWPKWNKSPWFKAPMEKAWFYERLFFEMVIAMVKDKYSIKDTMSVKISFMHYMKRTRAMLPVVFEKLVCSPLFLRAWLKKISFSITAAQTPLSFSEQYGYNGITLRNLNGVILRLFL